MFLVEPGEIGKNSKLDMGDLEYRISKNLEQLTGADIMVTPLTRPAPTIHLVKQHIREGAILIQRKHKADLIHSVGDRMSTALSRMRDTGAAPAQCVLLPIGFMFKTKDDAIKIDGMQYAQNYWPVYQAMQAWIARGGSVDYPLQSAKMLPDYLRYKDTLIKSSKMNPQRYFFVTSPQYEEFATLQTLRPIDDWRRTVAQMKGVGLKKVNTLRKHMLKSGSSDTLIMALIWMSSEELITQVPGWGPGMYLKVLDWLGIDERTRIELRIISDAELAKIKIIKEIE